MTAIIIPGRRKFTNLEFMYSRLPGSSKKNFEQFKLGFLSALAHTNNLTRSGAIPPICIQPVSKMLVLTVEWANMSYDPDDDKKSPQSKIEREKR